MRVLHQESGMPVSQLQRRFPRVSQRTIYRHARRKFSIADARHDNPGRPRALRERDLRIIVRTVMRMRLEYDSFSATSIQEESGITHCTSRTFRRALNQLGFHYLHARKKGLVSAADRKKRLAFARTNVTREEEFWRTGIAFYFDGVGFAHKRNPYSEARSIQAMAWRKPNEGLSNTTKGKKEGTGGSVASFFVAISYGHGVVLCKHVPWNNSLTGEKFASFVEKMFPQVFDNCGAQVEGSMFLQDGDPKQNSGVAREAWLKLGCEMFAIPARSPDLNPIENIFHLIRKELRKEALDFRITQETYAQFCKRVAKKIRSFPIDTINKTIDSMKGRLEKVISGKGHRTKY